MKNTLPSSTLETTRLREDVLRELNLFPVWQRKKIPTLTTMQKGELNSPLEATIHAEQAMAAEIQEPGIDKLNWTQLKKRVHDCTACNLRAACIQTVFGMGDKDADWLFVGSWPTEDDEAKGEPFAGQAGLLLDNMLAAIKLKRGANVYLANIVKCSGSIKRGPQAEEIRKCLPYLTRQIQLLQPKIIVALGHAAASALLGEDREWSSLLGKVHDFGDLPKGDLNMTIPLIITHHPAALLLSPLNKAQAWRDLCLARDTMQQLAD